jgi:hypothetical protein
MIRGKDTPQEPMNGYRNRRTMTRMVVPTQTRMIQAETQTQIPSDTRNVDQRSPTMLIREKKRWFLIRESVSIQRIPLRLT